MSFEILIDILPRIRYTLNKILIKHVSKCSFANKTLCHENEKKNIRSNPRVFLREGETFLPVVSDKNYYLLVNKIVLFSETTFVINFYSLVDKQFHS